MHASDSMSKARYTVCMLTYIRYNVIQLKENKIVIESPYQHHCHSGEVCLRVACVVRLHPLSSLSLSASPCLANNITLELKSNNLNCLQCIQQTHQIHNEHN